MLAIVNKDFVLSFEILHTKYYFQLSIAVNLTHCH